MTICVYCGSGPGFDPSFTQIAGEFGKLLAEKDHDLVYGGASIGVMGALANSVMDHGGSVTGVIPRDLFHKEVANTGITKLITVDDMHQRKSTMAVLSDAFVALPGGFGTMEELFEIITWNQIGIHNKPVTIFNYKGFYDPLIQMIKKAEELGFIRNIENANLRIAETVNEILN